MNQKVIRKSRIMLVAVLILISSLLIIMPVLAGESDSSGGGQGMPLGLASSVPANGQTGVGLQPEIKLTFNKNIINLAIRDANKNCFSLISSDGSQIPIEVIMADDQIHPEEKRNVSLKPLQELQPGTAYVVNIFPQLQAKNGTSLGQEVRVNFITEGTAPILQEPVVPPASSDAVENQTNDTNVNASPTDNKASTIEKTNEVTEKNEPITEKDDPITEKDEPTIEKNNQTQVQVEQDESKSQAGPNGSKSYRPYAIAGGLALLAALGYLYFKKREM